MLNDHFQIQIYLLENVLFVKPEFIKQNKMTKIKFYKKYCPICKKKTTWTLYLQNRLRGSKYRCNQCGNIDKRYTKKKIPEYSINKQLNLIKTKY